MKCVSTSGALNIVPIREAVMRGQPRGKGLYMPVDLPVFSKRFIDNLSSVDRRTIAFEVLYPFFSDDIPAGQFKKICNESFNFPIPVKRLTNNLRLLELFHGPSLAFKDVGACFLARIQSWFLQEQAQKGFILVATSGDTGAAVAAAFKSLPGIEVIILYPKNRVSPVQECMMLQHGDNVHTIPVDGTFDDCQRVIKQMLNDEDLNNRFLITTANSINIGRLLPQMVYYFDAVRQWPAAKPPRYVCVPSGNLGNLTAGVMASRMGLPVKGFIAATNANRSFAEYVNYGNYKERKLVSTRANAMDVGIPSNFERIDWLYCSTWNSLKKDITAFSISDEELKQAIIEVNRKFGYVLDPHSAVGYSATRKFQKEHDNSEILLLATAAPDKFPETVAECLGEIRLRDLPIKNTGNGGYLVMEPDFDRMKNWMINRFD